jgi:hypothetical protein
VKLSRAQRSTLVMRCRPGTVAHSELDTAPDLRHTTSCCAASGAHRTHVRHRFNCQTARLSLPFGEASQRSAARIFEQAPGSPAVERNFRRPKREPRARGTRKGPDGPAGLDASRHRGLSKSFLPAFHSFELRRGKPQVRQIRRRPARGVSIGLLRNGPGGRPFIRVVPVGASPRLLPP